MCVAVANFDDISVEDFPELVIMQEAFVDDLKKPLTDVGAGVRNLYQGVEPDNICSCITYFLGWVKLELVIVPLFHTSSWYGGMALVKDFSSDEMLRSTDCYL